jgi:hypothetical protein
MWEDTDDGGIITTYGGCRVVEVNMPHITYRQNTKEEVILNTTSRAFVSATREPD